MTRRTPRTKEELLGEPPTPTKKMGRPVEAHRVRLATAQAELAEIRGAKLRGELIPTVDVLATWSGMIADARQRLLAVPSRLGARLALPRETVAAMDEEIRTALDALARQGRADNAEDG